MNRTLTNTILAVLAGTSFSALAAGPTVDFDVKLNLTPACIVVAAAADDTAMTGKLSAIDINYTAFQTSAAPGGTSLIVRCSQGMAYGVKIAGTGVTGLTHASTGLKYDLDLSTSSTAPATLGTQTLTAQAGASAGTKYYIHASVPAKQAGTCTLAGVATTCSGTAQTHTVEISY